jgi:cytochrome c oxidase subunit 2
MAVPLEQPTDPATRARRSPGRVLLAALAAAVAVAVPTVAVAVAGGNFGMPDAATADGKEVVRVWRILLVMATAVAAVVVILLTVAVVSGARRQEASQSKGSLPLEIAYTAVPLGLVAAIFGVSGWLSYRMSDATEGESLTVETEAFRWGWRFTYPGGVEVVSASPEDEAVIVLPVDRTVTFELRSDDVIHSFFVPAFATKLDVVPGRVNELRVHPTEPGEYDGHCAEYCGIDHARMNFTVLVVEQDRFDAWLAGGGTAPP